jgi:hypothetical protein
MKTRVFSVLMSCLFMFLVLLYRDLCLEIAGRAYAAGAGASHAFALGTGFGIVLTSSLFMTIISVKSLLSYIITNKTSLP